MLDALEPRLVWSHFARIASIPRPSGREAALRDALLAHGRARGWESEVDAAGNLVMRVPATPGYEDAPTLLCQGHLDMVCEKNADTEHDFTTQGIDVYVDGDRVRARGTTLGADNGIGVAMALALADDPDVVHGPLELLCTVEEETGLTGAKGLDASRLVARRMLNLDTEEEGAIYVGCAGGGDQRGTFRVPRAEAPAGSEALELRVGGLLGGHSGLDAHLGRGNAIALLAATLREAVAAGLVVAVDTLSGGNLHNAIPREARAVVRVPHGRAAELERLAAARAEAERARLGDADPGLWLRVWPTEGAARSMRPSDLAPFLALLVELPFGATAMSRDIPGLVETSNNLAVVKDDGEALRLLTSSRSSVAAELAALRDSICAAYERAGGDVHREPGYPGWQPNLASPLLARAKAVFRELYGRDPEVKAIHAGLECGLLGERVPGLDMISLGPSIQGAHSPDEEVSVSSVQRCWTYLTTLVGELARG